MKALFAILVLPSVVSAAMLDAAEYDIHGSPLTYQGAPMVAWRATVDNTQGLTDLVGVRFKMNWTGTNTTAHGLWWYDPANPWCGASNVETEFLINGEVWSAALIYYPATQEWAPAFLLAGALPDPSRNGIIPAGCAWDAVMARTGADVKLFHSPASGDLTIDGVVTTLYDDNPLPQTVPEPSTLFLMTVLAYGFLGRRRRAANARL